LHLGCCDVLLLLPLLLCLYWLRLGLRRKIRFDFALSIQLDAPFAECLDLPLRHVREEQLHGRRVHGRAHLKINLNAQAQSTSAT